MASAVIWGAGTVGGGWVTAQVDQFAVPDAVNLAAAGQASPDEQRNFAPHSLYAGILGRNLAVYLWLSIGVFSAGLTTMAILAFNGFALGQAATAATKLGMPIETVFKLLLPHGVPELGAFLIAGAIGLQGPALLRAWWRNERTGKLLGRLWRPVLFGALMLAVAAGIEVWVTLPLARSMASAR